MINATLPLLYYFHFLSWQSQSPKHRKIPLPWHSTAFWPPQTSFALEKSYSQHWLAGHFKGTFLCKVKLVRECPNLSLGTYCPLWWKYSSVTGFFFSPSLSLSHQPFHLVALNIINNFLFSSLVSECLYHFSFPFSHAFPKLGTGVWYHGKERLEWK